MTYFIEYKCRWQRQTHHDFLEIDLRGEITERHIRQHLNKIYGMSRVRDLCWMIYGKEAAE